MAQKVVKVKAHKRLDGNGKVENVDAHLRTIEKIKGWKTGEASNLDMKDMTFIRGKQAVYAFDKTPSGKGIAKNSIRYLTTKSEIQNNTYGG